MNLDLDDKYNGLRPGRGLSYQCKVTSSPSHDIIEITIKPQQRNWHNF